jgi:hypothetical protein
MAALPPPINGTEQYLAAIHHRLGDILDRIAQPSAAEQPAGQAATDRQDAEQRPKELREPATSPAPAKPTPEPVEITEPERSPAGTDKPAATAPRPARAARNPAASKSTGGKKTSTKSTRKGT